MKTVTQIMKDKRHIKAEVDVRMAKADTDK